MAIFRFLKTAAVRHLGFSNSGNFNGWPDPEAPDAIAAGVQEQAEDIPVLPLLQNCLTYNIIESME